MHNSSLTMKFYSLFVFFFSPCVTFVLRLLQIVARVSLSNVLVKRNVSMFCQKDQKIKYIFVPICTNQHWFLMVVDIPKQEFRHLNSMMIFPDARQRFNEFAKVMVGILAKYFPGREWTTTELTDIPLQEG